MPILKQIPPLKQEFLQRVEALFHHLSQTLDPEDFQHVHQAIQAVRSGTEAPQSMRKPIYLPKAKSLPQDLSEFVTNRPKTPGYMLLVLEKGGQKTSEVAKAYFNQNSQTFMLHTSYLEFCDAKKTFYLLNGELGILRVVLDEASVKAKSDSEYGGANDLSVKKRGRPPKQPGDSDSGMPGMPSKRGRPKGSKTRSKALGSGSNVPGGGGGPGSMFLPAYPSPGVDAAVEMVFALPQRQPSDPEIVELVAELQSCNAHWGQVLLHNTNVDMLKFVQACTSLNTALADAPDLLAGMPRQQPQSLPIYSFPWLEVGRQLSALQQLLMQPGHLESWAEVPTAQMLLETMMQSATRGEPCLTRAVVTLQLLLHNLVEAVEPRNLDSESLELRSSFANEQSVVVTRALQVLDQPGLSDVMLSVIASVMQLIIHLRQLHSQSIQSHHTLCTSVLRATFALLDSAITRHTTGGSGVTAAAAFLLRVLILTRGALRHPVMGKFVCVDLVIFAKALTGGHVATVARLLSTGLDFCTLYLAALDRQVNTDVDSMVTQVYNSLKVVIEDLDNGIIHQHQATGTQQFIMQQLHELTLRLNITQMI